jgi:predicted PurR-regulated permease PerM
VETPGFLPTNREMPTQSHVEPSGAPRREPDRLVSRTLTVLVLVAAALLVGVTIVVGKDILAASFLALCLAVLYNTFAEPLVRRFHMKRKPAVAIVMVVVFVGLGAFLYLGQDLVSSQVGDFSSRADETYQKLRSSTEDVPVLGNAMEKTEAGGGGGPSFMKDAIGLLGTASQVVSGLILVAILSVFLAYAPGLYVGGFLELLPDRVRPQVEVLTDKAHEDLRQWLFSQLITMVACGVFVGVGLSIVGLPLAVFLGAFTMLVQFIPYFGAFISPIPGILVALGGDAEGKLPGVIAVYVIAQFLEGWVLTPLIQEKRSDLAPAVLLLFQALAGVLAGPMGVVVATPLLVVIKTVVDELVVKPRRAH